jgi:integrase/recombinase XerD
MDYAGLRQAHHRAVIAWERFMRETEHAAPSTIRRRLAALSSLYKHLVRHGHAAKNPVAEVERPAINRDEGTTLAFSKAQARKMLDAPAEDTVSGLRATAPSSRSVFKSGCGGPRSRRSRSATFTRTGAMTPCA